MKNFRTKIKKGITMLMGVAIIGTSVSIPSYASTADTDFDFNFHLAQTTCRTAGRLKENNSSTYIKASQLPSGGMTVQVEGSHSPESSSTWKNCTKGTSATISVVGQGRRILQYVNENGYSYARLVGKKALTTQDASGVWSPDTAGSYPALN